MKDLSNISRKTDVQLLALARRVANLAEEDCNPEFHDTRWIAEILETEDSELGVLSFDAVKKSVYVRLRLAEHRLLGRRAKYKELGRDECPIPAVAASIDEFQDALRGAWVDGYESIVPPLLVSATVPDDENKLREFESLAILFAPSFKKALAAISDEHPELNLAVRMQLSKEAVFFAKRRVKGKRQKTVVVDGDLYDPPAEISYRVDGEHLIAYHLLLHDRPLPL